MLCCYTEHGAGFIILLSEVRLSVVMLSVVMLGVVMLSVVMLSVMTPIEYPSPT